MKLMIINGPNLNLLGKRETGIYGEISWQEYLDILKKDFPDIHLDDFQSNVEGELVNKIQEAGFSMNGIILNPAAYTHTSVAIADAIKAISAPVIEVHISNIFARESFRHESRTAPNCVGSISGLGLEGYRLAIQYFLRNMA